MVFSFYYPKDTDLVRVYLLAEESSGGKKQFIKSSK